jgi:hypothetical protein
MTAAFRELEQRQVKQEELRENDGFITTVFEASQIASRNHEKEKLDALRNAVVNSGLPTAPVDPLKQMFLTWVDRFTVWHLRILAVLDNPKDWFAKHGKYFQHTMGTTDKILIEALPELAKQKSSWNSF